MSAAQTLVLYLVIGLPLFYGLLKLADWLPDKLSPKEYPIETNSKRNKDRTWTRH